MRRARLGVDGDHAFAGIGHLAESKDWEFQAIEGDRQNPRDARRAAGIALDRLRKRLAPEEITYAIDESMPKGGGE